MALALEEGLVGGRAAPACVWQQETGEEAAGLCYGGEALGATGQRWDIPPQPLGLSPLSARRIACRE